MNRKSRFAIAVALSITLVLIAVGAWAAPQFRGTTPSVPSKVVAPSSGCLQRVDVETAIFTRTPTGCIIIVELIKDPAKTYVPAPDGLAFAGDTFKVTVDSPDTLVEACYAYPPELANKGAKIYKLNEEATPNIWSEIPGAVINNGTICVTSAAGVFTLIGNP